MKLINAYATPYPIDSNIISEPGIPRAVRFTLSFDKQVVGFSVSHGMDTRTLAHEFRKFADELEELNDTGR